MAIALLAAGTSAGAALAQSQSPPPPQQQPPAQPNPDAAKDAPDKSKDGKDNAAQHKVFTNEDLSSLEKDDISVVGGKKSDGKPARGDTTKTGKQGEAYWHARAQKLRNQIADVDRQIAQLTGPAPTNGSGTSNSTAPPPQGGYMNARGARLQNLQNKKAGLQKQMDQLEEEARKAAVPPGWLR
jgi:hypothetical protein